MISTKSISVFFLMCGFIGVLMAMSVCVASDSVNILMAKDLKRHLALAIDDGHEAVVNELLSKATRQDKQVAMLFAEANGEQAVVQRLSQDGIRVQLDKNTFSWIEDASLKSQVEAARVLVRQFFFLGFSKRPALVEYIKQSLLEGDTCSPEQKRVIQTYFGVDDVSLTDKFLCEDLSWTDLHKAVAYVGSLEVQRLLQTKADVNAVDSRNNTPLHIALERGKWFIVGQLVAHDDLKCNMCNGEGNTYAGLAASQGYVKTLTILLDKGECHDEPNNDGDRPLALAADAGREDCIKLLFARGAGVNAVNNSKQSALHRACSQGHTACVKELLAAQADPTLRDELDQSPLHYAIRHENTVEVLLRYPQVRSQINTAANGADYTPFHMAVQGESLKSVEHLVKAKANINLTEFKETPLFTAVKGARNPQIITYLLENKADPNILSEHPERTPLQLACAAKDTEVIKVLLQNKADVFVVNEAGQQPWEQVVGNKDCLGLLIAAQIVQAVENDRMLQAEEEDNSYDETGSDDDYYSYDEKFER